MIEWILILTLMGASDGGQHTAEVRGFLSKDACVNAANHWTQRIEASKEMRRFPVPVAICVPRI